MKKRTISRIRLDITDSTNTYLRTLAEKGAEEGTVVTAREQTAGRGRRGKSFFSPADTGLYMSILVRPSLSVEDSLFITGMTAVATARAIDRICKTRCGIKWVNDIYLDNKKVSGVLCEGSFDYEANKVNYVVVGIGINLSAPKSGLPSELLDIATNLGGGCTADALAEAVTEEFFSLYDTLPSREWQKEYRDRSVLLGKRIEILGENGFFATAVGIDEKCRLEVLTDSGETVFLSSGEISTRIAR